MRDKFKELTLLLDEIDNDYGFGPNETLDNDTNLSLYIENFINYAKDLGLYDKYLLNLDECTGKSLLERLNEFI